MNTDNMITICTQEIIEWNESLFCPCDAFCSMMGEIDYDISFHDGKEFPFEKYEIINTPEYYVNVIVNENDIELFIIENQCNQTIVQ